MSTSHLALHSLINPPETLVEDPPMPLRNDMSRYGSLSQWLHWTTAALVIVLLLMGNVFDMETDEPGSSLFFWHSSLGVLVFLLAAVRLGWLLLSPAPALPQTSSHLFRVLARSTHVAFYALLFALPISGWLAASSERAPVSFFGIAIPEAPTSILTSSSADRQTMRGVAEKDGEGGFKEIHEVLGNVLLALAALHVLAALKHHFIDHDDVLRRMLPRARGAGSATPPSREHGLT